MLQCSNMARRKIEDRNTRKISKRGASYSVTLPIEAVHNLSWHTGQKVVVEQKGKHLIIKDWKQ